MLLNAVPDDKIPKIRSLLESLAGPLAVALANAPLDDEPATEEDVRAFAEARESLARGENIPHEEILKEFGLTLEDWDRMGDARTALRG
jgi:hypothetical protein